VRPANQLPSRVSVNEKEPSFYNTPTPDLFDTFEEFNRVRQTPLLTSESTTSSDDEEAPSWLRGESSKTNGKGKEWD